MRSPHAPLRLLFLVPALASCAFILDFDSLQAEEGSAQGGQLLSGGTAGSGGLGGSGACPSTCFDDDPCTTDGCDENDECLSDVALGLVLDGIDATIPAETHHRVTAVAGDDDFFLSAFSVGTEGPEVTLYRLDADGSDLSEIRKLTGSSLDDVGEPVSAAGLAFQQEAGLLHAYIGMKKLGGEGSRVRHIIVNGSTFEPIGDGSLVGDSYWDASPYNYPVAGIFELVPAVAWINEDQSIGLDGAGIETATLSANAPAMALALVASSNDRPAVIYGSTEGVFVERPDEDPVPVIECQNLPGGYLSFSSTSTSVPGFWLATWTKFGVESDEGPAFLTTEGTGMYCGEGQCLLQQRECGMGSQFEAVRNPATAVVHRPGTATGYVEVVTASPFLIEDDGSVGAGIVLRQQSVDLGVPPFENEAIVEALGPDLPLSAQPTSEADGFRGPDWPVIAHVPPDHYLVAWIEPAEGGDALRVQRYRMCLP
ncbi:MAG TPA: hypothetical protein VGK73_23930 [Polyangiaceae bacterium]